MAGRTQRQARIDAKFLLRAQLDVLYLFSETD